MGDDNNGPKAVMRRLQVPRITPMGDAAMLFEADGPMSLATQKRIWACGDAVAGLPGITDHQPGINNLLVVFDPEQVDPAWLEAEIGRLWSVSTAERAEGQMIELPMLYGGDGGTDLADVCQHLGLSATEVADIHSSAEYVIFAPGTMPGFGYLFGLPERLFIPRREVPVTRPRDLNVLMAGLQCSIAGPPGAHGAATAPTGWYMIGKLIDPPMPFDLNADPPGLMRPGDRIKFINMGVEP